jgi:predicted RNase H-like nuclease (RuvC/YqgF family)
VDALRQKYAARLQTLESQIQRAEQAVSREKDQVNAKRVQAAVSVGATILGAFLGGGRKTFSQANIGRATTAMRGVERSAREEGDVTRANESLDSLRQRRDALAQEVEQAVAELTARLEGGQEPLTEKVIRPRKTDIEIVRVALLWLPVEK